MNNRTSGIPVRPERTAIVSAVAAGAVTGLVIGILAFAGPIWAIGCTIAGALLAAVVAAIYERKSRRDSIRNAQLDREIGVSGGDIGMGPGAIPRGNVAR